MLVYLAKRLLGMIPLLLGITVISFAVIQLTPGDPTQIKTSMNPNASSKAGEKLIELYNLDKPILTQYWLWLKDLAVLDFGESFALDGQSVMEKISDRLPYTIYLNVMSMILIFMIALPLGILNAYFKDTFFDKVSTVFVFIGFAIPTFWLALLCMYFFGVQLGILPISGLTSYNFSELSYWGKFTDLAKHSILPVGISVFGSLAGISRYARNSMLDVLGNDYIVAAKSRGLSESTVLFRHALKNAMLPIITIIGLSIPGLIGGSVIFESIFSIPGMGQLFYQSVMMRDYPVVMGILVIGAVLTLIGNLIADILYAVVDPRIRYDKK